MTELEKIEYAKMFIDQLAIGLNPLDGKPIPENDIANNVRISRCFFYVSDILRQVIDNGGISVEKPRKPRKKEFSLTEEERTRLQISDTPLSVSEIAKRLKDVIDSETVKPISAVAINSGLLNLGLLEVVISQDGEKRKFPTSTGREIGILTEERRGLRGDYTAVLYSVQAQQFIYDNIEAIVSAMSEKNE